MNALERADKLRLRLLIAEPKQRIVRPKIARQVDKRTSAELLPIDQRRHFDNSGQRNRFVGDVRDVEV